MPQKKLPISAVVITKDEQRNIEDCLRSLDFCSEIVVVDSFSTDRTVEIARRFTDRVERREWKGINDQREYARGLASNEWVLDLDADERISPELAGRICAMDLGAGGVDGYYLRRCAFYLGRWIKHGGWYPDYKLRLYKKSKGRFIDNDPHDTLEFSGRAARLDGEIQHYTYPGGIKDQLRQINTFSTARAQLYHRKGRRSGLFQLVFRPWWKFVNTYFLRAGFLDGRAGVVISALSAYHVFSTWAKLWELGAGASSNSSPNDDSSK